MLLDWLRRPLRSMILAERLVWTEPLVQECEILQIVCVQALV
jgi:hypothetical protein